MTSVFLSCYNLPVIKQVAQVLGWIMNLLYQMFDAVGIKNIGLCILLFTIIIKMILLPMTIKQQKFTKLSSIMNPEIQAVQKKYRDRKDQESMMKMNQEMSAIYEKYGTSPTGGCLTLLIQMPILLALYGVVSQIPTYIPDIDAHFVNVGEYVSESSEYLYEIDKLDDLKDKSEKKNLDELSKLYTKENGELMDKTSVKSRVTGSFEEISASPEARFSMIFESYKETDKIIDKLSAYTAEDWTELLEKNEKNSELIEEYKDADWDQIRTELSSRLSDKSSRISAVKEEVDDAYDFLGVNLSQSPSSAGGIWSVIIPLLAALSQLLSVKISNRMNGNPQSNNADNPMGSSMKMMTYTMPVMSAVFCYTLPAGLGVYWIMSALVQTVQTVFIGKYFVKLDVNDIIKANIEKQNKKRAKQGLPPKKITTAATANVKNIKVEEPKKETVKAETQNSSTASKKGGIAAKANLVSKYSDKK